MHRGGGVRYGAHCVFIATDANTSDDRASGPVPGVSEVVFLSDAGASVWNALEMGRGDDSDSDSDSDLGQGFGCWWWSWSERLTNRRERCEHSRLAAPCSRHPVQRSPHTSPACVVSLARRRSWTDSCAIPRPAAAA